MNWFIYGFRISKQVVHTYLPIAKIAILCVQLTLGVYSCNSRNCWYISADVYFIFYWVYSLMVLVSFLELFCNFRLFFHLYCFTSTNITILCNYAFNSYILLGDLHSTKLWCLYLNHQEMTNLIHFCKFSKNVHIVDWYFEVLLLQ